MGGGAGRVGGAGFGASREEGPLWPPATPFWSFAARDRDKALSGGGGGGGGVAFVATRCGATGGGLLGGAGFGRASGVDEVEGGVPRALDAVAFGGVRGVWRCLSSSFTVRPRCSSDKGMRVTGEP